MATWELQFAAANHGEAAAGVLLDSVCHLEHGEKSYVCFRFCTFLAPEWCGGVDMVNVLGGDLPTPHDFTHVSAVLAGPLGFPGEARIAVFLVTTYILIFRAQVGHSMAFCVVLVFLVSSGCVADVIPSRRSCWRVFARLAATLFSFLGRDWLFVSN